MGKKNNGLELKDSYAAKVDRSDLVEKINQIELGTKISNVLDIIEELIIDYKAKIGIIKAHEHWSRYLFSKKHLRQHGLQCKHHKNPSKFINCSACNEIKGFLNSRNGVRECFSCKEHTASCPDENIDHNKYNHLLHKSMKDELKDLEEKRDTISIDLEVGRINQKPGNDADKAAVKSNFDISNVGKNKEGK